MSSQGDVQKQIKALQKKLSQVAKLKEKGNLTKEEQMKVEQAPEFESQIAALQEKLQQDSVDTLTNSLANTSVTPSSVDAVTTSLPNMSVSQSSSSPGAAGEPHAIGAVDKSSAKALAKASTATKTQVDTSSTQTSTKKSKQSQETRELVFGPRDSVGGDQQPPSVTTSAAAKVFSAKAASSVVAGTTTGKGYPASEHATAKVSIGGDVPNKGKEPSGQAVQPHPKVGGSNKITTGNDAGVPLEDANRPRVANASRHHPDVHLIDAVTKGYLKERREKYLRPEWNRTFCGVFRINPPGGDHQRFRRIVCFEYFMWSDLSDSIAMDVIKKAIATAIEVKTFDFELTTMAGKVIPYDLGALRVHSDLVKRLEDEKVTTELIAGKHVVDIRIAIGGKK